MRKLLTITMFFLATLTAGVDLSAAEPKDQAARARWFEEMRRQQNDFIARELELSDKQRADFFPVYNEMKKEIETAMRAARAKAKAVKGKGASATDADYDAATQAYLDARTKEAQIIASYYKKFSHILTKAQLYRLESAERKFDRMLMQQHPRTGRTGERSGRPGGGERR